MASTSPGAALSKVESRFSRRRLVAAGLAGVGCWVLNCRSAAGRWLLPPRPAAPGRSCLLDAASALRPWVLPPGAALRPPPPPAFGSPTWKAELAIVQDAVALRTPEQAAAAGFWTGGPGTVIPTGLWIEITRDLIARDDVASADAATLLATTGVARADAFICCWDA